MAIPENRYLNFLPFCLSLLLFAVLARFFFWQIGDDAYIYFRYVERALAGQWWSWTDQIPPIEGYSSPLWYFLLILAGKLGLKVEMAARSLGLVFALLTLLGTWALSRTLKASVFLSGFACLLLVLNQGFSYWMTSGLETSLYMAIYVWAAVGIVRERLWIWPVALIGVARPEGPLLLLAIVTSLLIVKRERIPRRLLLLALLPTLVWLGIRLSIYGVPLPNTYYAKATGDFAHQLYFGLIYCSPVLPLLLVGWATWFRQRNTEQMIVLGMITMLLGIIWLGGGDWMIFFRLHTALLGLLLAVVASQCVAMAGWLRALLVLALLPMLALVVQPTLLAAAMRGEYLSPLAYQEGEMTRQSIALAAEIRKRYPPGQLIAVNHAGALPWALPDDDFIDMAGLNDAHIARVQGRMHKKHDAAYVLGQEPDLIVLNTRVRPGTDGIWYHKGYWIGETELVEHPLFANYRPTTMAYAWNWQLLFPYSLVFPDTRTAWIVLYERKH